MSVWTDRFGKKNTTEEPTGYDSFPEESTPVTTATPKSTGGNSALSLKIVRPEVYDDVSGIADYLIDRCTVVLNLEATNKETAKRIIDFLSGVAYSIGGNIKRVATNTFVITPNNVNVTGEAMGEAPKAAPKATGNAGTSGGDSDFDF